MRRSHTIGFAVLIVASAGGIAGGQQTVRLRERLHDPAADLSGGQQQMLALGMAFLSRPRLLHLPPRLLRLPLLPKQITSSLSKAR